MFSCIWLISDIVVGQIKWYILFGHNSYDENKELVTGQIWVQEFIMDVSLFDMQLSFNSTHIWKMYF